MLIGRDGDGNDRIELKSGGCYQTEATVLNMFYVQSKMFVLVCGNDQTWERKGNLYDLSVACGWWLVLISVVI